MAEKKNKKDQLKEVTTGMEPIVGETPTVEIEGKVYTMRRLGMQDTFRLAKILGVGFSRLTGIAAVNKLDVETAGLAMIAAMPYAENEILGLFASLIGVSLEEIKTPELFPFGSEIDIVEALVEHQDLKAFFTRFERLMDKVPALKTVFLEAKEGLSNEQ